MRRLDLRTIVRPWVTLLLASLMACTDPTADYPQVGAVDGSEDEVVFRPGQVLTYEVTMAEADWDFLEAHGILEEWMPATLIVRGEKGGPVDLGPVGFRHKGSFGTLETCWGPPTLEPDLDPAVETRDETLSRPRLDEPWCRKISYKLKFNDSVKATRFHTLKKLNLHAGARDPSMLREMLAYSTFFDFGVDAPRTSPARLFINGTFMGLFIAVEDVDDRYAADHYPDAAGGNLYKEVWPDPVALASVGEVRFAEHAAGGQDEGDDPADFVALTSAVGTAAEQGSTEAIAPLVDVDGLLRYMAVDRGIKNWDGVTALYVCTGPECFPTPHNYYWYHDTAADGRFHLVPWDMDNTFQACDPYVEDCGFGADHPLPNWNVKPADCSPVGVWGNAQVVPSGCDTFLALLAASHWERFEELGRALATGPLRADVLHSKAMKWARLIEPIVAEDPVLDVEAWREERDALQNDILPRAASELERLIRAGYVVEPQPVRPGER
jgi:hypothetical protein